MKLKQILNIIFVTIVSLVLTLTISKPKNIEPRDCYRVYLDGNVIGVIDSKEELENYINLQQTKLKEKYNVDKIYIPNSINVLKDITFDSKSDSVEKIYNKINDIAPFTIKAYTVTIDRTNTSLDYRNQTDKIIKINVISKEIFQKSVEQVILSYIDEDSFKSYLNSETIKIETTGSKVENIYIEDKITIKENSISTTERIFMNESDLTKYLIFGDNDATKQYYVNSGDTIESIAYANKMSTNELLVANSNIKNADSLLYVGQKLTIGTLSPAFSTVVEKNIVEDEINKYTTEYIYDNSLSKGTVITLQEGTNGVNRVSKIVKYINGDLVDGIIFSSDEIVPTVNRVLKLRKVKKGDGEWFWPTKKPFMITSGYEYRWGEMHKGIDIIPASYENRRGSPIYAARDGVVIQAQYSSSLGHYVLLKHENGYYTRYGHMVNTRNTDSGAYPGSSTKYIKVGDTVKAGQRIGDMGNSGGSFGVHLHFEIWDGIPYSAGAKHYNPNLFY